MSGPRKAKHDIAPAIRASFLRGLEKYCRKKGMTYSDAMAEMIETEGLGYALDRVSKFTVRENTTTAKVTHEHKRQPTDLELAQELAAILVTGTEGQDSQISGIQTLVEALTGSPNPSIKH